MGYFADW